MPKRFYPRQDGRTKRKSGALRLLPWYAAGLFLVCVAYWLNQPLTSLPGGEQISTMRRQSIGSTETSVITAPEETPVTAIVKEDILARDSSSLAGADTAAVADKGKADPTEKSQVETSQAALPTVTLFNGCGVKGIGARAKASLERMGFRVVETRNARNFDYKKSEVLVRRENLAFGTQLAESLGIKRSLTSWDTTRSDREADVSLIIGSDYRKLRWKI